MALFVAVEGLPGCGKTTAVEHITEGLTSQGLRVREVNIGTAPSTPELRPYADLYPSTDPIRMMALWLLRIQQHEVIQAILPDMDVVMSDRSLWSAFAFDCHGNGVSEEFLDLIIQQIIMPDIVLLLDAPLWVLCERKKESRTLQDLLFAQRVADGYHILTHQHGWHVIDAAQTPEQVRERCLAIIHAALAEK